MIKSDLAKLKHLRADSFAGSNYAFVSYDVAQILDRAIGLVGPMTVTSAYRPADYGSMHRLGYALDVRPLQVSLWRAVKALYFSGARRIGISPDLNIIHIDTGNLHGRARAPYYFLEITKNGRGTDAGSLLSNISTVEKYIYRESMDTVKFFKDQLFAELRGNAPTYPAYGWTEFFSTVKRGNVAAVAIPVAAVFLLSGVAR